MIQPLIIEYLYDHQELFDEVASLWAKEWSESLDKTSFEKQRLSVERKANKHKIPFILIALVDGILAGTAAVFEQDLDTRHTNEPWLAAVVTKPEYRNRHIARRLVDSALLECKDIGISKVMLRTETATEYWRKRGWKYCETVLDEHGQETNIFSKNV